MKEYYNSYTMLIADKITEIFLITDNFCFFALYYVVYPEEIRL